MCKMKAIMHVEYQTKLLQILSNFLKSVPALPLEQPRQVGWVYSNLQLCQLLSTVL